MRKLRHKVTSPAQNQTQLIQCYTEPWQPDAPIPCSHKHLPSQNQTQIFLTGHFPIISSSPLSLQRSGYSRHIFSLPPKPVAWPLTCVQIPCSPPAPGDPFMFPWLFPQFASPCPLSLGLLPWHHWTPPPQAQIHIPRGHWNPTDTSNASINLQFSLTLRLNYAALNSPPLWMTSHPPSLPSLNPEAPVFHHTSVNIISHQVPLSSVTAPSIHPWSLPLFWHPSPCVSATTVSALVSLPHTNLGTINEKRESESVKMGLQFPNLQGDLHSPQQALQGFSFSDAVHMSPAHHFTILSLDPVLQSCQIVLIPDPFHLLTLPGMPFGKLVSGHLCIISTRTIFHAVHTCLSEPRRVTEHQHYAGI